MAPQVLTHRNLPHWYVPGAMHFVTYRLHGTIPQDVLECLREVRKRSLQEGIPAGLGVVQQRERAHKRFFAAYDQYLDQTCKIDWLARPTVAALIRSNLYYHNGRNYHLLAYCVMPNHVHILLQPIDAENVNAPLLHTPDERPDGTSPLSRVMHSLKSYTAHEANKLLGRTGQFWLHESYDHWVRDEDELERIVEYIAWNPVKAELAPKP